MTSAYHASDELETLLDIMCDDSLTAEQSRRLEEIVAADDDACWQYLCRIHLHGTLHWNGAAEGADESVACGQWPEDSGEGLEDREQGGETSESQIPNQKVIAPQSPISDSPLSTIHSFIDSPAFPYLFSTLVMCVAMLAAWLYQVDVPRPIAVDNQFARAPRRALPDERMEYVGQVTGMVDVQWSDPQTATVNRANVPLGRKYAIASGLMEISYDTGAKVILQGPVTYQVESRDGGFLSLGKLTARLEKKGSGVRGQGSKNLPSPIGRGAGGEGGQHQNTDGDHTQPQHALTLALSQGERGLDSSLSTIHYPLFTIKTPTATVTDLGTEFGVEVDRWGATKSHVFLGSIKVRAITASDAHGENEVVARENESVFVSQTGADQIGSRITTQHGAIASDRFVRRMPDSQNDSALRVLAWFRLGEDDLGAVAGHPAGEKTINHGHARHLERVGSPKYIADTAAPGSSLAMRFSSEGDCLFNRYLFAQPAGNFILEAWACAKQASGPPAIIVYNGNTAESGYGLLLQDGRWQYFFGGVAFLDSGTACEPGKWTHLALVYENGKLQLWINGKPTEASRTDQAFHRPDASFMIGGNPRMPSETFDGRIDEVRYSEFRSPFRPEMLLLSKEQRAAKTPISPGNYQKIKTGDKAPSSVGKSNQIGADQNLRPK